MEDQNNKQSHRQTDLDVGGNLNGTTIIGNGNTVQIFDKETIYNQKYLTQLLSESFKSQGELTDFFQDLQISMQDRNAEAWVESFGLPRILAEIKKQSPEKYEDFIMQGIISALGLPADSLRPARTLTRQANPLPAAVLQDVDEDLEFQDRDAIVSDIFNHKNKYFMLYGPSGTGKSHLLGHIKPIKHFAGNRPHVRCVEVPLTACPNSAAVLPQVISSLGGNPGGGTIEFARVIATLHCETPPVSQILFLFDFENDENTEILEWLLSPNGLIEDESLNNCLSSFGVRGLVSLKVVIAARRPMQSHTPACTPEKIPLGPLPPESLPEMLQNLARTRGYPVTNLVAEKLGQEIHYLTGGHPKCAKLMSVATANQGFAEPAAAGWRNYFNRYGLFVMQSDVLSTISSPQIVESLWRLSVFRRFDQRLLDSLLERKVLLASSNNKDISRQARELRTALESTYLISELNSATQTLSINFSLRRVLSLGLEYNSPELYRSINAEALKIFAERLHDLQNSVPRAIMFLMEFIYHMVKALEITPSISRNSMCSQLSQALQEYLPIACAVIAPEEQDDFLRLLQVAWDEDEELSELIRRSAPDDCLHVLTRHLQQFAETYQ